MWGGLLVTEQPNRRRPGFGDPCQQRPAAERADDSPVRRLDSADTELKDGKRAGRPLPRSGAGWGGVAVGGGQQCQGQPDRNRDLEGSSGQHLQSIGAWWGGGGWLRMMLVLE